VHPTAPTGHVPTFEHEVVTRLQQVSALAQAGGLDAAVELLATAISRGGVVHAFGTGHSEAFAMEVAGRAGGLIPTNRIALRDAVLFGSHDLSELGGKPVSYASCVRQSLVSGFASDRDDRVLAAYLVGGFAVFAVTVLDAQSPPETLPMIVA